MKPRHYVESPWVLSFDIVDSPKPYCLLFGPVITFFIGARRKLSARREEEEEQEGVEEEQEEEVALRVLQV